MAYEFNKLNVLLVEDDLAMRALIRDILDAFEVGHVRVAPDGTHAFHILKNFSADIVILDWEMKSMNRIAFLRKVRNAVDSPNLFVPAIMLTAHTDLSRVVTSRDAGITEFLAKPFTPVKLYSRIVSVVEDQRAFVRSENFFGPDRRRVSRPFPGMDRRSDAGVIHVDASAANAAADSAWQI